MFSYHISTDLWQGNILKQYEVAGQLHFGFGNNVTTYLSPLVPSTKNADILWTWINLLFFISKQQWLMIPEHSQ